MIASTKSMNTKSKRMKLTGSKCTGAKSSGTPSINSVRQIQAHYTRHSQGFTLMEIIVVIILIGAIVTFAANRILGGADNAKFKLAKTQVETLASKIDLYQQDVGSLPPSLDALVAAPGGVTSWLGPYAKPEELKDPWQHPLVYKVPGDGAPYTLISLGKDGQPGGSSTSQDIVHQ